MISQGRLRQGIVEKLASRDPGSSIRPSEVARELGSPGDWRGLMPAVREAAASLVDAQKVVITQKNDVVELGSVTGPIRIRRGPRWQQ